MATSTTPATLLSYNHRFCPYSPCSSHQQHGSVSFFASNTNFYGSSAVSTQRKKVNCFSNKNHSFRVSSSNEGVPNELTDDPNFVPLNADDPIYGPSALLLLGFGKDETSKVLQLLKDLDGEFLKIIHCTEDMLSLSVWDAMHTQQPNLEAVEVAKSMPRMCILSGLSGEEMLMFIDAFPEAGFEAVVFASLVPKSANKLLEQVVEEIIGDHEMMIARHSE